MTDAQNILVIFLSSFLALFLVLSCIALFLAIKILNHLKTISEKAENIVNTAEHVGQIFKFTAGPAAIAKLLANISEHVFSKQSKHKKRGSDE